MTFHYLTRAIITEGDSILLVREIGANYCFLPGGHIESGEAAKAALRRELMEEAGLTVEVGNFLGAVEHQWQENGPVNMEISLLFEAYAHNLNAQTPIKSLEAHLEFLWVPIREIDSFNLKPTPMRELLQNRDNQCGLPYWGSSLE